MFRARRLATGCAFLFLARTAAASDPGQAQSLFDAGRRDLAAGRLEAACAEFAESLGLDPSPGTELNLARCRELQGNLSAAWTGYDRARRSAEERQRSGVLVEARRKMDELASKLAFLTLVFDDPAPGAEVTLDAVRLEVGAVGTALPLEPGKHRVGVTAAHRLPWTTDLDLVAGEARSLTIPALGHEGGVPVPVVPPSSAPPHGIRRSPKAHAERRRAPPVPVPALVLGGAGLASLGAGLVFGSLAFVNYHQADTECPLHRECEDHALHLAATAGRDAVYANVFAVTGALGLATAVVLSFPSRKTSGASGSSVRVAVGRPGTFSIATDF